MFIYTMNDVVGLIFFGLFIGAVVLIYLLDKLGALFDYVKNKIKRKD